MRKVRRACELPPLSALDGALAHAAAICRRRGVLKWKHFAIRGAHNAGRSHPGTVGTVHERREDMDIGRGADMGPLRGRAGGPV